MTEAKHWANRLTAGLKARNWSARDAIAAMRELSEDELPSTESMLRLWRRWESADHEPGKRYQRLLNELFDETNGTPPDTDDLVELVSRVHQSDVDDRTLDDLERHIDQLCTAYSTSDPAGLRNEAAATFNRLEQMLDQRVSIENHRRILELAGWTAMLLSTLSYDLADVDTAEQIRRTALQLGHESNSPTVKGWAHEIRTWIALTHQDWYAAIDASRAGLEAIGDHEPTGVAVQLATQQAEAWAHLGETEEMNRALGIAQVALERHPVPTNPKNHFVLDHAKFDWMSMRCLLMAGENDRAERLADRLEREFTNPDGTPRNPMRISEILGSRALIALRRGQIEEAVDYTHQALDIGRKSTLSLRQATDNLAAELNDHSAEPGVSEVLARRSELLGSSSS